MNSKLNHSYGAEYMRDKYPKYTFISIMTASTIVLLSFSYPLIRSRFENQEDVTPIKVVKKRVINYTELSAPPPIDLEKSEPETYKNQPKLKKVKFLTPVAKKDEEVLEEEFVPTMDEMESIQIGVENQDGVDSIIIGSDAVVELPPSKEIRTEPYSFVQVMPEFKGGQVALLKYLSERIIYPDYAIEARVEGTVIIGFVIEPDGKITNVKVLRGVHSSIDAEAKKVISKMPDWIPGKQNGQKVRVSFTVPVKFEYTQ